MNNQEEVRESWNENFKWMKDYPQLVSLYESLPDWWLANFNILLAKKREEIEELRQPNQQVSEYYSGFNKAIDDIIKILT